MTPCRQRTFTTPCRQHEALYDSISVEVLAAIGRRHGCYAPCTYKEYRVTRTSKVSSANVHLTPLLVSPSFWLGPNAVEHLPLHPGGGGAADLPLDLPPRRVRGHPQPLPRTLLHDWCGPPQPASRCYCKETQIGVNSKYLICL